MTIRDIGRQLMQSVRDIAHVNDSANVPKSLSDLDKPTSEVSLGNNRLVSVGRPLADDDATTKAYVDQVIASANSHKRRSRNYGSAADWVAGFATSGAVILTLVQLGIARAEKVEDTKKEQASQVSTWIQDKSFYIRNGSDSPIYRVLVTEQDNRRDSAVDPIHPSLSTTSVYAVIPPGLCKESVVLEGAAGLYPSAQINFTDSQGFNWVRSNRGRLAEENDDIFHKYRDRFTGSGPLFSSCVPVDR